MCNWYLTFLCSFWFSFSLFQKTCSFLKKQVLSESRGRGDKRDSAAVLHSPTRHPARVGRQCGGGIASGFRKTYFFTFPLPGQCQKNNEPTRYAVPKILDLIKRAPDRPYSLRCWTLRVPVKKHPMLFPGSCRTSRASSWTGTSARRPGRRWRPAGTSVLRTFHPSLSFTWKGIQKKT